MYPEWDEDKSDETFAERGFSFAFAAQIFFGRYITREDDRKVYGETRMIAIGAVSVDGVDRILTVVYTDRKTGRRIISARPANRKERVLWQNAPSG